MSSRVRVLIERTKRHRLYCAREEMYLVGFQFVLSIRRLASRANVSRLLHRFQPGLVASSAVCMHVDCIYIYIYTRENMVLEGNSYISFHRYSGHTVWLDSRAECFSSVTASGQIDAVIVTLHHFFTRLAVNGMPFESRNIF